MTPRQAAYHARRAAQTAFTQHYYSREGNVRSARDHQDSAYVSAHIAFLFTLREHGFTPDDDGCQEPDSYDMFRK